MQIEELSLNAIKPYERNPRKNDSAVNGVAESIKQFGFKQPIVIDKDNVIVAGHTRYKAAKKLGLKAVPCVRADDLSSEQIKAYRILDNKLNELASWDLETLDTELSDIDFEFGNFDIQFPTFDIVNNNSRDFVQNPVAAANADANGYQNSNNHDDASEKTNIQSSQFEDRSNLPEELQGVAIEPSSLEPVKGDNKTLLDRVIIVYPVEKKQIIADILGLEKIDKVVYSIDELVK